MEFTKKIKSLVNIKQVSRLSVDLSDNIEDEDVMVHEKFQEFPKSTPHDPSADQDILDSIENIFYSDELFDASEYKLKNIPESPAISEISAEEETLLKQLTVVSKKLSNLILQNQSALAEELQRVTEMQKCLEDACTICVQSRSLLSQTKRDFTTASLGILASYRKREQFKSLLRSLHMIKTLQETDVRLRELLEQENYPGAIQLCLECQKATNTFKHFSCISELSIKLQDTLVMAEEQLDVAMSKVCSSFCQVNYEKLQAAYGLLGKTQTAVDQLLMHFASAIHNISFTIVLQYAEKSCDKPDGGTFQKKQYAELCKLIDSEHFTPCLEELCKSLWKIMHSYWCILDWHKHKVRDLSDESFDESYIKSKLEHGPSKVWQDVQQKVKVFILASDLSPFKFDDFIYVLAVIKRLMDVGEEFCGSTSEELQESVRKQSVNYFRSYHRGFMEELRTFLENEIWTICPVHPAFSTVHLLEFRFLKRSSSKSFSSPEKSDGSSKKNRFFTESPTSPFETKLQDEEKEDTSTFKENEDLGRLDYDSDSDDSEIPDELKKDYIDENADDVPRRTPSKTSKKLSGSIRKKQVPLLTNTALNVLRSFGKYMQMMTVLKPIAFDVLIYMTQLFDYYMYAVHLFFAKGMSDLNESAISNKLKTTLKRIRENQLFEETLDSSDVRNKDKIPAPSLSNAVNLRNVEDLFGLAERIAAAESLVFLAEQFEFLHLHLEQLIPSTKRAFLQQFCSQTVSQAAELRRPIYTAVTASCIEYERVVALMASVRWDVEDIMSQHSPYVDILLRELQLLSMKLSEVSKRVPMPKEALDILWLHCIQMCNRVFIEGFSRARSCTVGGRALMQLDYQQFASKAECSVGLQPLPEKSFVEAYIKAYYMHEQNLELFLRSHREYTNKQLISLVSCMSQINKKGRQRLVGLIEEGDRLRR